MLPLDLILWTALGDGLMLSVLLSVVIVGSLRIDPEAWLGDYPPDIQEAFGSKSAAARRVQLVTGVVFLVVVIGTLIVGLVGLYRASGGAPGALATFVYMFVMLTVFNLFDLLVLDWLLFVKLRPAWIVLPGTEGLAGYSDYGFHFRAFLTGLVATLVASAVVAGLMAATTWFASS